MRALRSARRRAGLAAACTALAHAALAQGSARVDPSFADRAIAAGRLDIAEDALYDAVARAPHQSSARGALGAFLAARGRLLVGATLLDEAIQFGADTAQVERTQLEVYRWTGEYPRMAALRTAKMSVEERATYRRAAATQPGGAAADTVELASNTAFGIGRIVIHVRGERVRVDVEPNAIGLVLPSSMPLFSAIEPTGAQGDTTFGTTTIGIGRVTLGPVPVRLMPGMKIGTIGLDVLSRLTPTFDRDARTLVVRSVPYRPMGGQLPFLLTFPGVTFVVRPGEGPVAIDTPAGHAALRGTRWTFDIASAAIVVAK